MKINFFYQSYLIIFLALPFIFIIGPAPWNISFFLLTLISLFIIYFNLREFNSMVLELKYFYFFLLVFCLFIIFNSFISLHKDEIFFKSITYLRYLIILFALPFVLKIESEIFYKYTKIFFFVITLSLLIVIISSLAELFRLDLPIYTKSNVNYRLNGPFGDEAIVGSYLYFFFPTFLFLSNILKFSNFYRITLSIFVIFIIFASGERMIILMSIGFFILYIFLNSKKKVMIISFLTTILFLFIFSIKLIEPTYNEKIKSYAGEKGDYSYLFRIDQTVREFKNPLNTSYFIHFKTAYAIFDNHKVFGSGAKSFRHECFDLFKYDHIEINPKIRCRTHPHNIHLEILSDTGIIGYILFISTFLSLLIFIFKNHYCRENLFLIIPILLFLFPLRTSGSFFGSIYGGLFWYQVIILIIYTNKNLQKFLK